MNSQRTRTPVLPLVALYLCMLLVFCTEVSAEQDNRLHFVRTLDNGHLFGYEYFSGGSPPDLSGVGFPPGAQTLLVFDQPAGANTLVIAAPPKNKNDRVDRAGLTLEDTINIAYDSVSVGAKGSGMARLFAWDSASGKLITVKAKPTNGFDKATAKEFDVFAFGVDNPQGLTLNPDTGQLFVLDPDKGRIVAIQPKPGHNFTSAEVATIVLPEGLGMVRGLAYNPADQHLYILNTASQTLFKLTLQGELDGRLTIADETLAVAQGMVFAPSRDPTDDPGIVHLYVATRTGLRGEISEWALPGPF